MEFMSETQGYLRAQVDAYVAELRQSYSQVYEMHMALLRQHEALEARFGQLQAQYERELAMYRTQKESIAQALIQAQCTASNLIAGARLEAEQLRQNAAFQGPAHYASPYAPPY
jgi:cell division septum initiation protein DivIVA